MKKNIILICLFIASVAYSQNSVIVPKKGKVTFGRQESITDELQYKESVKAFLSEATKSVVREKEDMDEPIDSSKVESVLKMLNDQSTLDFLVSEFMKIEDDMSVKFHHIYSDETIYEYVSSFDFPTKDYYLVINTKSSLIKSIDNDSITVLAENKPYEYSKDEIIRVEEFRNETKEIYGFKCFKVILEFKSGQDINEDEDFISLMNSKKQTKELWVTESIKSLYHPVLKYKAVLEKYYPLEVSEFSEVMNGHKIVYTITEFDLNR
ncbi:hypothetical protein [Flavobacterium soli]|uniref:hypothetical protein n=1 Tax=Flavobacterium soli TaxID=344881 RepID=UPI0003F90C9A|nr:hypothetical protein [Flavobacterium soli]